MKKGEYGAKECCTNEGAVDYAALYHSRYGVLRKAFARFSTWYPDDYYRFCYEQGWWLEDYALYMTAKGLYEGKSYLEWPEPVRSHTPEAIRQLYAEHEAEVHFWKFCQYEFSLQWTALKAYAGENGIEIMGDIPIYVAADSADVWAAPELFLLDACGAPKEVAGCPPDAFSVYRQLRSSNPSPYLYYFKCKGYEIAGASPEMLVNVTKGIVTTKPIAGTIPRGLTEEADRQNEQTLLHDPKERAEHTMLVDLGRNDVGKVSKFGTVEVTNFMQVERYSKVMHLVSDVKGILREDKTAVDALLAALPAGTLSGAPKVRAMELIDALENKKRCLYGGTIGYLGFDGNIDTCIAIRTALYRNGRAYVQAGGGVVADSDPQKEYEETRNKANAVLRAMEEADAE